MENYHFRLRPHYIKRTMLLPLNFLGQPGKWLKTQRTDPQLVYRNWKIITCIQNVWQNQFLIFTKRLNWFTQHLISNKQRYCLLNHPTTTNKMHESLTSIPVLVFAKEYFIYLVSWTVFFTFPENFHHQLH